VRLRVSADVWRIAADTADYEANDFSEEQTGGRWNRKGIRVVYTSVSRVLACLESVVHLGGDGPVIVRRSTTSSSTRTASRRCRNANPPTTRPISPTRPDVDECCHGGCDPCVFDLYEDAVELPQPIQE
jgi:hypothetical protein